MPEAIVKSVRIKRFDQQGSDCAYRQTQPHLVRLVALEEIRSEYHRWKFDAVPRLQTHISFVFSLDSRI